MAVRRIPPLRVVEEDGFHDFDLGITRGRVDRAGSLVLEARGRHGARIIGIRALIRPGWREKPVDGGSFSVWWGVVELQSMGAPSNALVRLMDAVYGTHAGARVMRRRVSCQAGGLGMDPGRALIMPVKMKLFFAPDDERRYAELYLNVDLEASMLQLREKDPDYRRNVVLGLARPGAWGRLREWLRRPVSARSPETA